MKILVTGGAGFVGSHSAISLLSEDNELSIIDNLSNGKLEAIKALKAISKKSVFPALDRSE